MNAVGLVLSGGGARGAAHLGVLKALEELGVNISAISGVSAGALIGALYAAGQSPEKILNELKQQSYFSITDVAWLGKGLFSMNGLRKVLTGFIKTDSFECLEIPLFVTATDITTGQPVTFGRGNLFNAILGSCSVPVIFEPVVYDGHFLLDGGIVNNFPVEPLLSNCDTIIGSHVNKLYDGVIPVKLTRSALVEKCFHLAIAGSVYTRAAHCKVFIEPLLSGYSMFDISQADKIFESGYEATMKQKENIYAAIQVT